MEEEVSCVYERMFSLSGLEVMLTDRKEVGGWRATKMVNTALYLALSLPTICILQGACVGCYRDLNTSALYLTQLLSLVVIGGKVTCLLAQRKAVRSLCRHWGVPWSTLSPGGRQWMVKRARLLRRVAVVLTVVVCVDSAMWLAAPTCQALGLCAASSPPKVLLFRYPFDQTSTPYAQLVFLLEMNIFLGAAFNYFSVDLFLASVVLMLDAHIHVLVHFVFNEFDKQEADDKVVKEFTEYLIAVFRVINSLRNLLSPLLGLVLLSSLANTCIVSFTIINVKTEGSMIEIFKHASHIIKVLLGLFLYCWMCSSVQENMESLHFGIYDTEWHRHSAKRQKSILIALQQTIRFLPFKAMGMITINVQTFIDVLRASYTYYTLLCNFKND